MSSPLPGLYSLYGQPVSHSLSPLMFNYTFEKQGLDCKYTAIDVDPERLQAAIQDARSQGINGFNVTMPHKVAIIPLLDKISDKANQIGSVNTVIRNPQGLEGHNTDGEGALKALIASNFDPKGARVLVIGAGGTARAIVHTLSTEAEEIVLLNRSTEKARSIVEDTKGAAKTSFGPLSKEKLEENIQKVDLIVNATPTQTGSLLDKFGVSIDHSNAWIFDLAYDNARAGPIPSKQIHPLELLVQQASLSYEIWFARPGPLELMRSILVDHIKRDWR